MWHIPEHLIAIEAETNDPLVGQREPDEIRILAIRPGGALQRKSGDAQGLWLELLQVLLQLGNSQACVDDVLEDEHILALQARQVITDDFELMGALGAYIGTATEVVLEEWRAGGLLVVQAQLGKVLEKSLEKAAGAFQQAKAV